MKYGCEWGDWCTSSVSGPYGVSLWKNIRRAWLSLSLYILYDVGDGLRVKFCQDWWCGETSLVVCYPELFRICQDNEVSMVELMKFTNGVLHQDVRFLRVVHD